MSMSPSVLDDALGVSGSASEVMLSCTTLGLVCQIPSGSPLTLISAPPFAVVNFREGISVPSLTSISVHFPSRSRCR